MLINEAGVVRAIKRAYKGDGYTVNSRGGIMSIYTQSWYIQARREVMPRKVLATIVEHAGMIPGDNEPTNIMKDRDPQLVIPETAAEEMNNWRVGERGDDVDLVPVIMQGFQIFQAESLACWGIPLSCLGMVERDTAEHDGAIVVDNCRLVDVFREVRRVLRPDGTLWVNIGDSYATRSGAQPPTNTRNVQGHTAKRKPDGYKYKDLMGIPWLLAFALRADGWYLRQDIIWHKTNAMPESVRDRCTKAHLPPGGPGSRSHAGGGHETDPGIHWRRPVQPEQEKAGWRGGPGVKAILASVKPEWWEKILSGEKTIEIPQLATGGIVTAPTILEAGEGGEPEAVLPLSKLSAMLQGAGNMPEVPDMGNWEDEPEEAPLAQLAKMLDDWTKNNKPGPQGPGLGGAGSTDYQEPQGGGNNDSPPPEGGQNPPGGGVDTITFAPVFNFYGPTTPEQAKEAGQISFAEFKHLYQQMKAEERCKNLRASTH